MLTVYAPLQHSHRQAHILKGGAPAPSLEAPERAGVILAALDQAGLGPVIAPQDPGLEPLLAVHDRGLIDFLRTASDQQRAKGEGAVPLFPTVFPPPGQRRRPETFDGLKGYYCVDMEVPIDGHTWPASLAAARCAWTGAQHVRAGTSPVYALCRPPGHHAGPDFMGGYCYLNNAAIAARALCGEGERVAVLDIDYHHGNGTQAIFYADPAVCYGSLHVDPRAAYPYYAGYVDEKGAGAGAGTNWNVPLSPGTTQEQYLSALESLLDRVARFAPCWLVVSAGFDTYIDDPLSTFHITTAGFVEIGARIRALGKPTLVVQEGGYYLPHLGQNVVALLEALV
jgi:acetoin utilization deacetylase AcuC-like enzyme